MPHSFRALFLLAAMVWQAMSVFGASWALQGGGDLEHLIVHGQYANHHHHADNTLHLEDDGGPVQHLHADSGNGSPALLTSHPAALVEVRIAPPPAVRYAAWRSPTLEGPLRPPKQRA